MKFLEVAGQTTLKEMLVRAVKHQKIASAYLFIGQEGVGALPLASAFATYLNCTNPNKDANDSCGVCESCMMIANLSHPDVHYTYPVVNNQASGTSPTSIDFIKEWQSFMGMHPYASVFDWLEILGGDHKQGNIFAQECQHIAHQLSLKSYVSTYKVQIIWMAEYLKQEGNKLLKLLEEPPAQTIFLLIAANPDFILSTILSRAQVLYLQPLQDEEVISFLQHQKYTLEQINLVLPFADNNIRKALLLLKEDMRGNMDYFIKMLNLLFVGTTSGYLDWIKQITDHGKEFEKQFLLYSLELFEKCCTYFFETTAQQDSTSNSSELEVLIKKMCTKISLAQILACTTLLEQTIYHLERNADDKLILHALMIQLKNVLREEKIVVLH